VHLVRHWCAQSCFAATIAKATSFCRSTKGYREDPERRKPALVYMSGAGCWLRRCATWGSTSGPSFRDDKRNFCVISPLMKCAFGSTDPAWRRLSNNCAAWPRPARRGSCYLPAQVQQAAVAGGRAVLMARAKLKAMATPAGERIPQIQMPATATLEPGTANTRHWLIPHDRDGEPHRLKCRGSVWRASKKRDALSRSRRRNRRADRA
jgi:hypothetical protein